MHLAFLISFMEHIDQQELQEFLNDMDTAYVHHTSSKCSTKFEQFLSSGSPKNATFEVYVDMMRHCDEIVAIALAERLGGKDGYALLLSAVKSSMPFSFVNSANSYALYCVKLLHTILQAFSINA